MALFAGYFQSFDNEVMKSLFLHNDTTSIQGEQKGKKKRRENLISRLVRLTVPSWTHTLLHSARHFPSPPGSQFEIHNNHVKNLPIKLPISINHRPPDTTTIYRATLYDTPHSHRVRYFFAKNFFPTGEKRGRERSSRQRTV